jgi:hypothetical protein
MSILVWLENTFGWVLAADSLFAYPMILTFHTFGLALLVGMSVAISLRVLGIAQGLPLAPMERFYPFMLAGFWFNVVTGVLLFAPEATRWAFNPDFLLKMAFVFLGMYLVHRMRKVVFRDASAVGSNVPSASAKLLAASSIAVWVLAITTGRLSAYVDGWNKFASLFVITPGH